MRRPRAAAPRWAAPPPPWLAAITGGLADGSDEGSGGSATTNAATGAAADFPAEAWRGSATVARQTTTMGMHVLVLPAAAAQHVATAKRGRVLLLVRGVVHKRATYREPALGTCLRIGLDHLRQWQIGQGDSLDIALAVDPDPDAVDTPEELLLALRETAGAEAKWAQLAAGKQRGLSYYVADARTPETRIRRALDLARRVAQGEWVGPPKKSKG